LCDDGNNPFTNLDFIKGDFMNCFMTKNISMLALTVFATSAMAFNAPNNLIPGDRAVSRDYKLSMATVVAIDPAQQFVTLKFDTGKVKSYPASDVAVAKGCLGIFCVGDFAINPYNAKSTGRILAINAMKNEVGFKFEGLGYTYTLPAQHVLIGHDCTGDVCVGDRAVNPQALGAIGYIVAINSYTGYATLAHDNGGFYTYLAKDLSILTRSPIFRNNENNGKILNSESENPNEGQQSNEKDEEK